MSSVVAYIRSLPAIRERCSKVYKLAENDQLDHWTLHPDKEDDVVEYCARIIEVSYGLVQADLERDFGTDYGKVSFPAYVTDPRSHVRELLVMAAD
jgi:hypothetical protein